MIKLFASDLDGTLLSPHHVISDVTAQAIRRLQTETDIEFMVVTGRDYISAKRLLDQHQLKARIIAVNGAAIYHLNGTLASYNALDQAQTRTMIDYFLAQPGPAMITLKTLNGYYVSHLDYYTQKLNDMKRQVDPSIEGSIAQFEAHLKELQPLEDYRDDQDAPLKLMLISPEPQNLIQARQYLASFEVDVTSSSPENIEITSLKAQKGLALSDYCHQHHLKLDEVLTIGDSINDRSMLTLFPNSYAMENASPEVKALAHFQAPHHAEDGVAQVIDQLIKQQSQT